jgi:hypothetical protein
MAKQPPPPERLDEVSADLPYELQNKLFEQMATMSIGGVGLTITLAGTLLEGEPLVWLAVVEFGIAALMAVAAQQSVIAGLFKKTPTRKTATLMTGLCSMLIGMGVGSLGGAVYFNAQGML